MRCCTVILVVGLALVSSVAPAAEETPLVSRVVSVGLFKNGLAVVKREVELPTSGQFRLEDVPEPVHGTLWVECDADVQLRVTSREVEVEAGTTQGHHFQTELVGRDVQVFFREGSIPPVRGKVLAVPPPRGEQAWNRNYEPNPYGYLSGHRQPDNRQFLILEGDGGRHYVDLSMVAHLQASGGGKVKQRLPVLLASVEQLAKPATMQISYLAKGMAWAPSYRVDLSDTKNLVLRQKAVLKNELGDILETEVSLISGFPSVEFGHVTSPLALTTNWTQFFTQLSQQTGQHANPRGQILMQNVSFNSVSPSTGPDFSAIPTGDGVDVHYQSIGKVSLAEGDSLMLDVADGKAAYERIVEWIVPDNRDGRGHYNRSGSEAQDDSWDAVRFRNPLKFPMTTGPAMIVEGDRFNGQQTSHWVNPGEQTTLRVTKALSIRTRSTEFEEPGERRIVYLGGNDFRRATVKGELTMANHRAEKIKIVVRRRFSGELLSADGEPIKRLRQEGVYSVNKRQELIWTLEIEPGQTKSLNYRYEVLVDN